MKINGMSEREIMLSKYDIENEIGEGIVLYPFKEYNIKGNSINLTCSKYAWMLGEAYEFSLEEMKNYKLKNFKKIEKNSLCSYEFEGDYKIFIPPHKTVLIQTEEVISTGSNIGGNYNSKVGIVSKGLGHIGTMLGPNFCGHSLISLHNITDKLVILDCSDTFVSLTFFYLNTPTTEVNGNKNGHLEKFSNFGIILSDKEIKELDSDWKLSKDKILEKLKNDQEYVVFINAINERKQKDKKWVKNIFKRINLKHTFSFALTVVIYFSFIYFLSIKKMDTWILTLTTGFSGILVFNFNAFKEKLIKQNF